MRTFTVSLGGVLLLASRIGPGMPAENGPTVFIVPGARVELGQELSIPVLVDTSTFAGGFDFCTLDVINEETSRLELTGWSFGEGMKAHIQAYGEPPEIVLNFDREGGLFSMYLQLARPYDSFAFGNTFLVLRYRAIGKEPGATMLFVSAQALAGEDQASVDLYYAQITLDAAGVRPSLVLRGDVNGDRVCNLSDAIGILGYLFQGGREPDCLDAADVDDDGSMNLTDAVSILVSLFLEGASMNEECRADETDDSFPACRSASCAG